MFAQLLTLFIPVALLLLVFFPRELANNRIFRIRSAVSKCTSAPVANCSDMPSTAPFRHISGRRDCRSSPGGSGGGHCIRWLH